MEDSYWTHPTCRRPARLSWDRRPASSSRSLGYEVARLDTGPRQPHAERLYRDAGYAPIGNFNGNPIASFFGEKPL